MKTDAVFAGAAEVKEESVDEFPDGGYTIMFGVLLHIYKRKQTYWKYLCDVKNKKTKT